MYGNSDTNYDEETAPDRACCFDRGCAVLIDDFDIDGRLWIRRAVHQVTPEAGIRTVAEEQLIDARRCAEGYPNASINVIAFTVTNGELTPEQNAHYGWCNYARAVFTVPRDPAVRRLTESDLSIVKALCEPALSEGDDTNRGRQLSEDFHRYNPTEHPGETMWGIFDGQTLVGIATVSYEKGIDLAWPRDASIAPSYRGKGYGKRLVLSALADHPDKKQHCQVARDNAPSAAPARSLGFTLAGAGLFP